MKKREKKLQLNRETVLQLDLRGEDLVRAHGGVEWTGCLSDCTECGGPSISFKDNQIN